MRLADIQPDLILAFLDHLEHERHNAVRSRNLRLTALRAFLKFAGRRDVASLHVVERALARADEALRAADAGLPHPRGDAGGARAAGRELVLAARPSAAGACSTTPARGSPRSSACAWSMSSSTAQPACTCTARGASSDRCRCGTPTVTEVRAWLRLNPTLRGEAALLPNRDGQAMSRSNVAQRLDLAVSRAQPPSSPASSRSASHLTRLRHTTAMHLLQSGVPFNVIALWLGHESPTTTHRYVEADLAMKEKALAPAGGARHQDAAVPGTGLADAIPADAVTMRRFRQPLPHPS